MVKATQTTNHLNTALDSWRHWCHESPQIKQTLGGLSNTSYLLSSKQDLFVLRLNATSPAPGIDRLREKHILEMIKAQTYAPELIWWQPNYLVTRYQSHDVEAKFKPREIAALFNDIHKTPFTTAGALIAVAEPTFDPWQHLDNYHSAATRLQRKCITQMQAIKPVHYQGEKLSLCHNDLLNANLLRHRHGITVIDWEYARLGHPVFDLAVYAETYNLDQCETANLLDHYLGDVTTASLNLHRILYRLIEALWLQGANPNKDMRVEFESLLQLSIP